MSMTEGRPGVRLAARLAWALLLCVSRPRARAAIYMTMEATKSDGGAVKLCVGLDSGRPEGRRHAERSRSGTVSAPKLKPNRCAAVPDCEEAVARQHAGEPAVETYRALVFALDNVDPIRDGAALLLRVRDDRRATRCCAVRFDRLGVSDPVGTALPITGQPRQALP